MISYEKEQRYKSLMFRRRWRDITNTPPIAPSSFLKMLVAREREEAILERIAQKFSVRKTFATKTGRLAIYLFLKGIGVKEGDEIIVSAFNCLVVPLAVLLTGAEPVYVDADDYAGFDIDDLQAKISSRTKCIIVPILDGVDVDLEELLQLGKRNNLAILLDGAHTILYRYRGQPVLHDSRIDGIIHSFSHSKMFSLMGGGILLLNDANLIVNVEKAYQSCCKNPSVLTEGAKVLNLFLDRIMGSYAYLGVLVKIFKRISFYEPEIVKEEYQGKETQSYYSRLLRSKLLLLAHNLESFEKWNSTRRYYCQLYKRELESADIRPLIREIPDSAPLHFPIVLKENADGLYYFLMRQNIYVERWFHPPLYPAGYNANVLMYKQENYPRAQFLSQRILNLPLSPRLQEREILTVCHQIKTYLKNEARHR
jgi:perosamine synthetase